MMMMTKNNANKDQTDEDEILGDENYKDLFLLKVAYSHSPRQGWDMVIIDAIVQTFHCWSVIKWYALDLTLYCNVFI